MSKVQIPDAALTRHDVKARLGISETTFWRWLKEGRVQGFYVGQSLRFLPEDIQRCIDEGKAKFERKWGQQEPHGDQNTEVANG